MPINVQTILFLLWKIYVYTRLLKRQGRTFLLFNCYMFRFFSALLPFKTPLTTITKLFWPLESRGETRSEQVLALPLTQSPIEPFPRYPLVPNLKPFATPSHFHCVSKGSKRVLCPVVISERTLN